MQNWIHLTLRLLLVWGLVSWIVATKVSAHEKKEKWSAGIKAALKRAGKNQLEIANALQKTPEMQLEGMVFLITNMPDGDLKSLSAKFLQEDVDLAYKTKNQVPWGRKIPKEIFLNYVLPYANVDETREPWRKKFVGICLPLVEDCKTPLEAVQLLNSKIFKILKVKYSTKRKKPHQCPSESIEQGMASCTGLSILLVDACRSVGIPVRLVGTPRWTTVPGNHTWVEIWDDGWHFTGACEPHPKGLGHAWFVARAAKAKKDSPLNAIYAASFRRTKIRFPLVWNLSNKSVSAENVTDHYTKAKQTKPEKQPLSNEQKQRIKEAAQDYFAARPEEQTRWKFDPNIDQLLVSHEAAVREVVWDAYKNSSIHGKTKKDFNSKKVRFENHISPYTVKTIGNRPKNGWPLFIAMHGGGGVPKRVNDSQWKVMQGYYRDQKSVTGYKYLALRAPNDRWNGFYAPYVPPLVTNLIRQFLLFDDIDSNKVYLMGYSHGGYGAFYIGPKIPHRFAAIHASAAAPTDGTISPRTLRNTCFTFMIGERDTKYGRRNRCEEFDKIIQVLKKKNPGLFPVTMEFKKGFGHGGLPDRDKIKTMYSATRNPKPKHLTWDLTDSVINHFFWLSISNPRKNQLIDSRIFGNKIVVKTTDVNGFIVWLDDGLVNLNEPVSLNWNGKILNPKLRLQFASLCESLQITGDPYLAFTCKVRLH